MHDTTHTYTIYTIVRYERIFQPTNQTMKSMMVIEVDDAFKFKPKPNFNIDLGGKLHSNMHTHYA